MESWVISRAQRRSTERQDARDGCQAIYNPIEDCACHHSSPLTNRLAPFILFRRPKFPPYCTQYSSWLITVIRTRRRPSLTSPPNVIDSPTPRSGEAEQKTSRQMSDDSPQFISQSTSLHYRLRDTYYSSAMYV